jgi:hypothetical protein
MVRAGDVTYERDVEEAHTVGRVIWAAKRL